jgi:SAM-dependent methyltransferase
MSESPVPDGSSTTGADARAARCAVCGGQDFQSGPVLWDELVEAWELTPEERAYIDRQQGAACIACGANLRSSALAKAIATALGTSQTLREIVAGPPGRSLAVLEVNEAGHLHPVLSGLPQHQMARYPAVDIRAMPYADAAFDLVVHSDTLEHVPDPVRALAECRRVLKSTGALCFTIPMVVGRMSRNCDERPPSYHGQAGDNLEDYRVVTEFGADAWTWCIRAGFDNVTIACLEFPAAHAFIAWKQAPWPIFLREEADRLAAEVDAIKGSRSWRLTAGLRKASAVLGRLRPRRAARPG